MDLKKESEIDIKKETLFYRVVISLFLITFIATGCATTGNYEKVLASWVGSDVSSLIEAWGPPSSTFEVPNGSKMYTWLKVGSSTGYSQYDPNSNAVYSSQKTWSCKTTFTVDGSGRIQRWRWEGNACRSK